MEFGKLDKTILNSDGFNWNKATITAADSLRMSALFGSDIQVMMRVIARRATAVFVKSLASMRASRPRVNCNKEIFIFNDGVCVESVMYLVMVWN